MRAPPQRNPEPGEQDQGTAKRQPGGMNSKHEGLTQFQCPSASESGSTGPRLRSAPPAPPRCRPRATASATVREPASPSAETGEPQPATLSVVSRSATSAQGASAPVWMTPWVRRGPDAPGSLPSRPLTADRYQGSIPSPGTSTLR